MLCWDSAKWRDVKQGDTEDSPVHGASADQMETEQANHEEEEKLIHSPPSVPQLNGNKISKLQNGNQLPGGFAQQVNGEDSWNHFKSYTEVSQIKRHHQIHSCSADAQNMFENNPYRTNGEITHAYSEPSSQGLHQEKCQVDPEVNGKADNVGIPLSKSDLHCFPEFTDTEEVDCGALQEQQSDKRICAFAEGDVFARVRGKPTAAASNGATMTSAAMEGLNSNTLEEALCQYYPDHSTPSPPQENATEHLATEDDPERVMHSPFLTSGLPTLPQIPSYGRRDENFVEAGRRVDYGRAPSMESQQPQQQLHPPQDISEGAVQEELVPGGEPLMLHNQNTTGRLQNCLHSADIYQGSSEKLNETFLGITSQTGDTGSPGSFSDESALQIIEDAVSDPEDCLLATNSTLLSQKYEQQVQLGVQQKADSRGQAIHYGLQNLAGPDLSNQQPPANLVENVPDLKCDQGLQTQSVRNAEEIRRAENALALKRGADGTSKSGRASRDLSWIDLNSSPPAQAWKTFDSHLHQRHLEAGSSEPTGGAQTQDFKMSSMQQHEEYPQLSYKKRLDHINQPQHGLTLTYNDVNDAGISDNYKFDRTAQLPPQPEHAHEPMAKKQCMQQQQLVPNQNKFPQLPAAPTLMQKRAQFPHDMLRPQGPECSTLQMCLKAESRGCCSQQGLLQTPQQRELQRHAALRMYLLQKQERQEHQKIPDDFKYRLKAIKTENDLGLESLSTHQAHEPGNPSPQIHVKQEEPHATCALQQDSIITTTEHHLKQYQLAANLHRGDPLAKKLPNKVKVETSGPVTVLSMHANLKGVDTGPTAEKNSLLQVNHEKNSVSSLSTFLESPRRLLDPRVKSLLDMPVKTQYEIPSCHCVEQLSERDEGPYYTHLGAAPNVAAIRELMEQRYGQTGSSIRIEKVVYTGKEGKSNQGCPIAKWVIRRGSEDEKLLVLVRERAGHTCATAAIVVVIVIWEGISTSLADQLYTELSDTLTKHGVLTNRRCAFNEERTCACQGWNSDSCGASFSFGCSWSMYYNGCKFARSKTPRKFKLLVDDSKQEEKVEQRLQNLATLIAPVYKKMAPDAYSNQVEHENRAESCRLGLQEGRPFSGVTVCMDFCAHAHRDLHNMQGGSTVVCTLTREDNRQIGKIPEDEQLHVLPLYTVSPTDEFGSVEGQQKKAESGAIQVLSVFRREVRKLSEPAKPCRLRRLESRKSSASKPPNPDTPNSKGEKALQVKLKQENAGDSAPESGSSHMAATALAHQSQLVTQHQQLRPPPPYPGSPQHPQPNYGHFPHQADPFSKSPASGSCYSSALRVPSESHPASSYPGALNNGNLYRGYPCNGTVPVDAFSPYYSSNVKHLSIYPSQGPQLYSPQYAGQPPFGVGYPPQHADPGAQVSSYGQCNTPSTVHPMGPYPPFSLNGRSDLQYMEAVSQQPSSHPDYGAMNKSSQYGAPPNSYFAQAFKMFAPPQDSIHVHDVAEMELRGMNGKVPGTESSTEQGFGLPNGNIAGGLEKPESEEPKSAKNAEEWSDNEHNFLDPNIGGIAVAPSHGSILIECAKRELHATTPLKNPDRNHPTRISLVFYQHKNLNEAKHGLAAWEAKMAEKAREKEEDAEKNGNEATPSKGKKIKREHGHLLQFLDPSCRHDIRAMTQGSVSSTTNTYMYTAPYVFTKVSGPYSTLV
ncbi:methylcytosine dioxygenase TET2-like [Paramormyrops kingsleyae]|uniref:methylcytosine dioxygenase TET2-like n=1 Tax=Paramormyrops kingsleyae TaxID=1676925 RepID=UPI003B97AF33